MKIAIIGSGLSGLAAASELSESHQAFVFEAGDRVGGHANTVTVNAFGGEYRVDTGFLMYNETKYRRFAALLADLGVEGREAEISYSLQVERDEHEFRGSSLRGLLDRISHSSVVTYPTMICDVTRFRRAAREILARRDGRESVGEFMDAHRYSRLFVERFLAPLVSPLWPAGARQLRDAPLITVVRFLDNFGLLKLGAPPRWKTIAGGSSSYIDKLAAPFREQIYLNSPVRSVARTPKDVILKFRDGKRLRFDYVIIATQADQALAMLLDAGRAERQILGGFPYDKHTVIIHLDGELRPREPNSCVGWRYTALADGESTVSVTYDLSQMHAMATPAPILLTLNPARLIRDSLVLRRHVYYRPAFGRTSLEAQQRFREINGVRRTYYCGAYWGCGIHEDAVCSAQQVVAMLTETPTSTRRPAATAACCFDAETAATESRTITQWANESSQR